MIQILIIISVIILLVGLMVKWPKPGLYLFKIVCLMLLLSGLIFALFFTLMGLGKQALNIDASSLAGICRPSFHWSIDCNNGYLHNISNSSSFLEEIIKQGKIENLEN